MTEATLESALIALIERRNRLIQLDMENHVQERGVATLRQRINACTEAIREVKARLG